MPISNLSTVAYLILRLSILYLRCGLVREKDGRYEATKTFNSLFEMLDIIEDAKKLIEKYTFNSLFEMRQARLVSCQAGGSLCFQFSI